MTQLPRDLAGFQLKRLWTVAATGETDAKKVLVDAQQNQLRHGVNAFLEDAPHDYSVYSSDGRSHFGAIQYLDKLKYFSRFRGPGQETWLILELV